MRTSSRVRWRPHFLGAPELHAFASPSHCAFSMGYCYAAPTSLTRSLQPFISFLLFPFILGRAWMRQHRFGGFTRNAGFNAYPHAGRVFALRWFRLSFSAVLVRALCAFFCALPIRYAIHLLPFAFLPPFPLFRPSAHARHHSLAGFLITGDARTTGLSHIRAWIDASTTRRTACLCRFQHLAFYRATTPLSCRFFRFTAQHMDASSWTFTITPRVTCGSAAGYIKLVYSHRFRRGAL